jgi:benzoyl-CoA reductase/2-hydroxyglutaryl-CoA dehydratase subunit BcrC/BadD/HgdB
MPEAITTTEAPATLLATALSHFGGMVDRCLEYAEEAKRQQRPVVGIMCEFTPRELIMAAGGVPVCLCGGSEATIGPAEQFLPNNLPANQVHLRLPRNRSKSIS